MKWRSKSDYWESGTFVMNRLNRVDVTLTRLGEKFTRHFPSLSRRYRQDWKHCTREPILLICRLLTSVVTCQSSVVPRWNGNDCGIQFKILIENLRCRRLWIVREAIDYNSVFFWWEIRRGLQETTKTFTRSLLPLLLCTFPIGNLVPCSTNIQLTRRHLVLLGQHLKY